jgi:hypothetical protein
MPVVEYQGMPLVAESPHLFGRHRPRAMETETPGGTLRDSSHEKPRELLIQGLKKREEERV